MPFNSRWICLCLIRCPCCSASVSPAVCPSVSTSDQLYSSSSTMPMLFDHGYCQRATPGWWGSCGSVLRRWVKYRVSSAGHFLLRYIWFIRMWLCRVFRFVISVQLFIFATKNEKLWTWTKTKTAEASKSNHVPTMIPSYLSANLESAGLLESSADFSECLCHIPVFYLW